MRAGNRKEKTLSVPVVIISGILLSILSLALFFSLRFLTEHFSPSYKNAERYLREGKIDEAFAVSEKINGETSRKLLLRGKLFLARSLQGRDNEGWRNYGKDEHDWLTGPAVDSALSCFEKVLQIDPNEFAAYYFMGVVYKEKGWYDKAEEVFQEIIRRDSKYVDAHIALGALYTSEGKPRKALKYLYFANELKGEENALIAKNIAYVYRFYLQQPDSAIIWFNRYLNIAHKGDIDIQYAKKELQELNARYPEFAVKEVQPWQQQERKFIPRNR